MDYFLVNTVSKRRTKMARKVAPAPQKYAQRFLGGTIRLTRGKYHKITQEQLEKYEEELKAKCEVGALEIHIGKPSGPLFQFDAPKAKESTHETSKPEEKSTAEENKLDQKVESAPEESKGGAPEAEDFSMMTNKELIKLILDNSDAWEEKELRKMKKSELLELLA